MPPKIEDLILNVHEPIDITTSRDPSTNDVNEEQATVSTAELEYIIIDNNTVDRLADKVVEVNEQSGILDSKTVLARDVRHSLDSLGMVGIHESSPIYSLKSYDFCISFGFLT